MSVRVLFMGTPDFAVPTLEALVAQGWDVLVVTQPDKKVGRKHVLTPPPVKRAALELGLTVLQPQKVRNADVLEQLAEFKPDLCVTAAYGQLLPDALLSLPRVGALNVHASLLPRWRGAAPIHRAIMAGDKETGVTLMEMVTKLDAGPMLATRSIPILDTDTVGTLHDKLALLGAEMCRDLLPSYLDGEIVAKEQPEEGVTYAAKIERKDEFIHWGRDVREVDQQIRGLSPWPGAVATDGQQMIKIWAAKKISLDDRIPVGQVRKVHGQIVVGCSSGTLQLETVQPAGRKRMPATDWFSGQHTDVVSWVDEYPQ